MAKRILQGNQYRTTMVCVDSYENGVLQGRFFNPACPQGRPFGSLMQFFTGIDEMLDRLKMPQSFTANRSFSSPAAVSLRVMFRRNASWQGAVSWLEGGQEESFRSALELAFLMDSALESRRK